MGLKISKRWKILSHFDNRWQLALSRSVFRRYSLDVYYHAGMGIIVDNDAGDAPGVHEVLVSGMYQNRVRQTDLKGKIRVLDIGANAGTFAIMLRGLGFDIETLVAVELNPLTYYRMAFNVTHNIPGDVRPLNAAVVGRARVLDIMLGKGSTADSIEGTSDGSGTPVHIEGITLDSLIEKNFGSDSIHLAKIDIEGAEYEVFAEATHGRVKQCRYILIEIHPNRGGDPEAVKTKLKELGFELVPPTDPEADPDVYLWRNVHPLES